MKHNCYSVHDRKAGAFLPPFFMHAEPMAERVFGDCCNDESHNFGKHPEDYTLFRLGSWNDQSGEFVPEAAPVSIGNGVTYLIAGTAGYDVEESNAD